MLIKLLPPPRPRAAGDPAPLALDPTESLRERDVSWNGDAVIPRGTEPPPINPSCCRELLRLVCVLTGPGPRPREDVRAPAATLAFALRTVLARDRPPVDGSPIPPRLVLPVAALGELGACVAAAAAAAAPLSKEPPELPRPSSKCLAGAFFLIFPVLVCGEVSLEVEVGVDPVAAGG